MLHGYKCDYKKQVNEDLLDNSVSEIIIKLVRNPKFASMMQDKINMQVDTTAIEQELANYEKSSLRHLFPRYSSMTSVSPTVSG